MTDLPDWTTEEALVQARLTLRVIRELDSVSLGVDVGYRTAVLYLADAFEVIDRDLRLGQPLPCDWQRA